MNAVLDLSLAESLCAAVQSHAKANNLNPLGIAVLDAGGQLVLAKREDGASFIRIDVATAKAWTALSLSSSSRQFAAIASERPEFATTLREISQQPLAPAAGGVRLISDGIVLGAVGASGDSSDNDELAVIAAIADLALTSE